MDSDKDCAADEVMEAKAAFELALSNKRKYPVLDFQVFARATRKYIEMTAGDPRIHRSVAGAISGLREYLEVERKQVPGDVLYEADRLHCLLFAGYDPQFEGDEPPGL